MCVTSGLTVLASTVPPLQFLAKQTLKVPDILVLTSLTSWKFLFHLDSLI